MKSQCRRQEFQKYQYKTRHFYCNLTDNSILINYPAQLSLTKVEFNQTSEDFNLDDIKIIFDPLVNEDIVLRLNINCNNIKIPQYNLEPPYNIQNLITDYELIVDLKTFNCQLGEYLNSTSGGCIFCDPSLQFYSVQVNAQSCNYKDDQKMRSIKSSMIELKSEYWRAYYYSDKIEHCFHNVNNCLGGWKPGYQSCFLGHIGALCEQCDLYNIRGDGFYSISSPYQCGNCNQILDNVLTICLISFWTLISTFLSVLGTIRNINDLILEIRLKSFKINPINSKVSSAILIKVFTNYFQILSTISTFQLQIPPEITSIINNVGNPIDSMAYSFDCFLITILFCSKNFQFFCKSQQNSTHQSFQHQIIFKFSKSNFNLTVVYNYANKLSLNLMLQHEYLISSYLLDNFQNK